MNETEYTIGINAEQPREGDGILEAELAFEFVPSSHVKLCAISLPCGKHRPPVTITVRVRRDKYGAPGAIMAETSRTLNSVDWHRFDFTAPVLLPRQARYWIGVVASTGEETPVFDVIVTDSKPEIIRLDPTGRAMYSPPLTTHGVPVPYFASYHGARWTGPFSGGFVARLHFSVWTAADLEAVDPKPLGVNELVRVILGSHNVLHVEMNPEDIDDKLNPLDPANCVLSIVSTVPVREAPPGLGMDSCQCVYTLGAPFLNPDEVETQNFDDSLLQLGHETGIGSVEVSGPGGMHYLVQFRLVPNVLGRLSKLVVLVPTQANQDETDGIGYSVASGLLSELSFTHQVPLEIVRSEQFFMVGPGSLRYVRTIIKPYSVQTLIFDKLRECQTLRDIDAFQRVLTLYREGANTWNPMLRFLSWFKAIEAVGAVRAELGKRRKGVRFPKSTLRETPFFKLRFPELMGTPLTKIASEYLPGTDYRHAVAHWSIDESRLWSHDQQGGVILYHHLCMLEDEVLQGLIRDTVSAANSIV